MKKFFSAKFIGYTVFALGLVLIALWMFLDNSDSVGNWIDVAPYAGAVIALGGFAYAWTSQPKSK